MKRIAVVFFGLILVAAIFAIAYQGMNWPASSTGNDDGRPSPTGAGGTLAPELVPGSAAPDFTLPSVQSGEPITLSRFRSGKPVVLVFGSFTCDLFCPRTAELERIYQDNKNRARFLFISITEAAHKTEGFEFMFQGGLPDVHTPPEEWRAKVARAMNVAQFTWPAVIDNSGGIVETRYHAHPLRLYAVDADGRVALDLGRVTYGKPWDLVRLEKWLKALPLE